MKENLLDEDLNHVLSCTGKIWDNFRNKKIFITGGTGFIGTWLIESFIHANEILDLNSEAVILTRNPDLFKHKAPHLAQSKDIKFVIGDIRDFVFPDGHFHYVIHAATDASAKLNEENPLLMLDTIVDGTRRCLDFARQAGVEKVLFLSSGAVYGKQPTDLKNVPEEYMGTPDSTDPRSAYGIGKRTAELLCALYSKRHGLHINIARCFAFVGPYLPLDSHFAIGNFISDALKGGPIVVKGDGTPYRSYLYSSDLVIWLWTILMNGESCRPYNVGSEDGMSIAEVAHAVAEQIGGVKVNVLLKPSLDRSPERYVPSTKRALDELKLKQSVSLSDAIKKTEGWYGQKT